MQSQPHAGRDAEGSRPQLQHAESMRSQRRALITPPAMETSNPAASDCFDELAGRSCTGSNGHFSQAGPVPQATITPTNPRSPRNSSSMNSHRTVTAEERLDQMMAMITAQAEEINRLKLFVTLSQKKGSKGNVEKENIRQLLSTVKVLKVKKNTRDGGPEAKSDGAEAVSQATTFRPHASRGDPEVGTNSRKVHPHPDHLEVTDIESEQETVLSWVRNIFDALDADGSGDLRIEELRTAKCHLLPWFGPDSEMGRLLDRLERNPNDSIIWEQFAAAIDFPDQIMTNTHVPTLRHNSSKPHSSDDTGRDKYNPSNAAAFASRTSHDASTALSFDNHESSEAPEEDHLEDEEEESHAMWVSVSLNAYGAFIHVALQSGLRRACLMCLPMVALSVAIQFVFAWELYNAHKNDFQELREEICGVYYGLHIFATMIFCILMSNNVPNMWQACMIVAASTHHKNGDGDAIGALLEDLSSVSPREQDDEAQELRAGWGTRLVIAVFAVLTEVCTWGLILVAGVIWIVSAASTDFVIRSTVAVMFVLNVDEIVFESCCSPIIHEDVVETKYRIPNLMKRCGLGKRQDVIMHYFGLFVYLPLLATITIGTVIYMRYELVDCWGRFSERSQILPCEETQATSCMWRGKQYPWL